ncbi:hypothetical protein N9L68_01440, partial [bacterium]|nr:hypothetical protein [bacterium]
RCRLVPAVALAACAPGALGGPWSNLFQTAPLLDLRDHALAAYSLLAAGEYAKPAANDTNLDSINIRGRAMDEVVSRNGLALDHDTLANGDCGPDALLRNIERLDLQCELNASAKKVLTVLQKRYRDRAIMAMRLMLVIWLRDHANDELLPGTSIAEWVAMEGYESMDAFIADMRRPRTWITTPMMVAASAVFNMQIICFVGGDEPQLVAAQAVLEQYRDVPMVFIANSNNVHFYAVQPQPAAPNDCEQEVPADDDIFTEFMQNGLELAVGRDDNETFISEDQTVRTEAIPQESALSKDLYTFAQAMTHWKPFAAPKIDMNNLVHSITASDHTSAVPSMEALRWRDFIKLAQWEDVEREAGIHREHVYAIARTHYSKCPLEKASE